MAQPASPFSRWVLRPGFFAIVSACWVLLLYRHALGAPFLYDDVLQIPQNPQLTSWHGIAGYFLHAVPFSKDYLNIGGAFYRPLFWMSLALDRLLWGLNPTGFHVTNLLLHWMNGMLVFLLLRKLSLPVLLAGGASIVWLGLPINAEAVAWISGRSLGLAMLFLLAALLAAGFFLRLKNVVALIAYFSCSIAAVLSYEGGLLVLPLTILVAYAIDRWPNRSWWILCGAAAIADAIYLVLRGIAGARVSTAGPAIFPVGAAFFKYLAWIVLPIRMSIDRSVSTPSNHFSPVAMAALAALAGVLALAFWIRDRMPEVAGGMAWMSVALLPFGGIIPTYQGMAERYTYVAAGGMALALVGLALRVPRRAWTPVLGILCLWMAWGAWRLNARVLDWNNEIALYKSSLEATPNSAVLLYNLGVASAENGETAKAIDSYQKALAINPRYVGALNNLGNLLRQQRRVSEATALYQRALAIDPKNPDAWLDLGDAALQAGNLGEAQTDYQQSLELKPTNVEATSNLGAVYQRRGDLEMAKRQYERAIQLDPEKAGAYTNLGSVLIQQGRLDEAIPPLKTAIAKDPSTAAPYFDLGVIYEQKNQYTDAAEMYRKTLAIDPDHVKARVGLVRVEREK